MVVNKQTMTLFDISSNGPFYLSEKQWQQQKHDQSTGSKEKTCN